MSFSPGGILFYCGGGNSGPLSTVDTATGLLTNVATLTGSPGALGDSISAGAYNSAGIFYGVVLGFSSSVPPNLAFLVTINTTTGAVTTVGATVDKLDAIAFAGTPGQGAPALSKSAILALMVLLGSVGMSLVRRRSRSSAS